MDQPSHFSICWEYSLWKIVTVFVSFSILPKQTTAQDPSVSHQSLVWLYHAHLAAEEPVTESQNCRKIWFGIDFSMAIWSNPCNDRGVLWLHVHMPHTATETRLSFIHSTELQPPLATDDVLSSAAVQLKCTLLGWAMQAVPACVYGHLMQGLVG